MRDKHCTGHSSGGANCCADLFANVSVIAPVNRDASDTLKQASLMEERQEIFALAEEFFCLMRDHFEAGSREEAT
jgi:hypothetical protein